MRVLIVLLLLSLSFFLIGCLEQKNSSNLKDVEQISNESLSGILGNNSSVDVVRTAIIEALEQDIAINKSKSRG